MVYEITREGDVFMWRVQDSPQVGRISIDGNRLSATWGPRDGQVTGSASGTITESVDGKPSRVQWSNRVVFTRRASPQSEVQIDPQVATRIDPGGEQAGP